ncbi:MAG: ArsR family transcriptional regulator [Pseudonocardia sp.]|nr:ArsR family transcriptional regulator [Pseudonocardia sp.]
MPAPAVPARVAVDLPVLPAPAPSGEGRTREAVARLLMEQGPVTAAEVAAELELSAPAVRRHLDALIADGEAETRDAPRLRRRARGRPAKHFLLTDAGRARFGHGYDDLATAALRFLAAQAGAGAVEDFARSRVQELVGAAGAAEIARAASPEERAEVLARVLTARGYAAQSREAGHGVQLCQHHCPVAHVAAEFPELCEAETKAFAELLGTHVQRLATIARGDTTCTTHVPLGDFPERHERSDHTTTVPKGRQSE